jgi:hypothetical protein
MSAGLHSLLCRPEHLYAVRKNYLSSTVKRIRLTFLSNVVAYPCRHSRKRIGIMGIFFSVILSAAKDLIAACHGHEILRCAQDDNSAHPLPATRVSATRVSRRPPETSETSETFGRFSRANLGNLANPSPEGAGPADQ